MILELDKNTAHLDLMSSAPAGPPQGHCMEKIPFKMQTIIKAGLQRPGIYTSLIYDLNVATKKSFCPNLDISMKKVTASKVATNLNPNPCAPCRKLHEGAIMPTYIVSFQ